MMNDRHRLRHPVLARATRLAAGSLLALAAVGATTGSTIAAPGASGAIWTTNAPCTDPPQNRNLYATGDTVYVRGEGFDATAAFGWTITGQPGGASGDPRVIVSSGSATTDADGGFCLAAYVVTADDWGEYTVDVTQDRSRKNDNYQVLGNGGTTDPDTTDPGTTDPGTTDPGTTDPGTTDPGTTGTVNTKPGTTEVSTAGASSDTTDTTTVDTTAGTADATPGDPDPNQDVLGEVGFGPGFELPATDTVTDVVATGSSILLILALAGLAGLAVLLAPSRRRAPDATA